MNGVLVTWDSWYLFFFDISLRFEGPSWILLVLATRQTVEKCFIVRYDLRRFLACNSLILYAPGKRWDLCLRPSYSLVIIISTHSNRAQVKKGKKFAWKASYLYVSYIYLYTLILISFERSLPGKNWMDL